MDEEPGGEWLPLKQAAGRLGVSIDTVRRRIQRGDIGSRREQTPQGYRWLVRVDITEPNAADVADDDTPGSPRTNDIGPHDAGQGVIARDTVIEALRAELDHRAREIAELHAIIGTQARALEATMSPAALAARVSPAEPPHEEPAPGEPIAQPAAPRGFWTRLRRAFGL
jgi:hypothetical protein